MELAFLTGDLLQLSTMDRFDVIVHGCNCFCAQRRGIAAQMVRFFETNDPNKFPLESPYTQSGSIQKLGNIQWQHYTIRKYWNDPIRAQATGEDGRFYQPVDSTLYVELVRDLVVVNAYTQYHWSAPSRYGFPADYDAIRMCFRKINHQFRDKRIGVPDLIGAGLAGGDRERILNILVEELTDVQELAVVKLPKEDDPQPTSV